MTIIYHRYVDDPTTMEKELHARSGQPVDLIGLPFVADPDEGIIMQRIRFADGYEADAFEDELHDERTREEGYSMTTVTIHYRSPKGDPFKIPRPHRFTLTGDRSADLVPECEGGEIGRVKLVGFCDTTTPSVDAWVLAKPDKLLDPGFSSTELSGWYAQFIDADGNMFGYTVEIDRIEVS